MTNRPNAVIAISSTHAERLAEAVRKLLPGVEVCHSWTAGHSLAESSGALLVAATVGHQRWELGVGVPTRGEGQERTADWLAYDNRPLPTIWDPDAPVNLGPPGARVPHVERMAEYVRDAYRYRPDPAVLAALRESAGELARAQSAYEEAQRVRDLAVRAAHQGHLPLSTIMAATGLSKARVYQLASGSAVGE